MKVEADWGDLGLCVQTSAEPPFAAGAEFCSSCGGALVRLHRQVPDWHFGAPGAWSYLACAACRLARIEPLPAPAELADFYASYYPRNLKAAAAAGSRLRRLLKQAILAGSFGYPARSPWQKWLGRLLSACAPLRERAGAQILFVRGESRGTLLDVGCGVGVFLSGMRELGWQVIGVEPDPQTARIAQREFGLEAIPATLEAAHLAEKSVDVVTMSHVIEHVADPESVLKEAWRVLKPRGRVAILTPNVRSLGHRVFGECWQHLSPPYHLQLFSVTSLAAVARRAGFTPVVARTWSRSAGQTWKVSRRAARRRCAKGERRFPALEAVAGFLFHSLEAVAQIFDSSLGEEIFIEAVKT